MKITSKISFSTIVLLGATASVASAATQIRVDFQGAGPVGFAPLYVAFTDPAGGYDVFQPAGSASSELETLAEVGDPSGLIGAAPAGANTGAVLGDASPVFTVGGSSSAVFTVDDTNTVFNYAAMVLASNDWFIGNDDFEDISSLIGASNGTSISLQATQVWDAGTEQEDFMFSAGNPIVGVTVAGNDPTGGTAQGGTVSLVTADDPYASFANIPAGFDTTTLDYQHDNLAFITLTVVPEPSTGILGALTIALVGFRRRR